MLKKSNSISYFRNVFGTDLIKLYTIVGRVINRYSNNTASKDYSCRLLYYIILCTLYYYLCLLSTELVYIS
jgi:hypothetical protein